MIYDPRITTKESTQILETKSISSPALSFPEFLLNGGHSDLSAYAAIQLYTDAMPFFNAVSLRAELFAQIPIRIWDKKKEEFIDDHPSLELLAKPNADVSQVEFLEQLSSFYDITGENFMVATGRLERPPLELAVIAPQKVTFGSSSSKFGMLDVPNAMWVTSQAHGQITFVANESQDLGLRFINERDQVEIWHTRSFNPLRSSVNFRGMSRARPIWLEIQQYISGNKTNLSMLKRGTKLSLAWVNNRGEELTDTQWDRLQEEAQKYQGDENAGGTPILDGMDVKAIQQTNRDMEFKELQESMLARISTIYRIPLALLLSQSMTLNNLETSLLQLFDMGVLPQSTRIYGEMTRFILSRYEDSEDLEFRYNESDIPALRVRLIEIADRLSKVNVNTIDELRGVLGDEPLASGGDVILRPATLIPVGEDGFTGEEDPVVASKFKELLRDRGYSPEQIDQISKEAGL